MKEENAISRHPIYKVIKKINHATDLDSWIKTGEYGVTSLEAVNGSLNFALEIKPTSANGHVMQRQIPSDVPEVINFTRFLRTPNVWSEWIPYHLQGPAGEKGEDGYVGADGPAGKSQYVSYTETTTDDPVMTEAEWSNQIDSVDDILSILNGDIVGDIDAILLNMVGV